MHPGRWTAAALAALVIAAVPGALRLGASDHGLVRAELTPTEAAAPQPSIDPQVQVAADVVTPPPVDQPVAIVPPPAGALTGAPAPVVATSAPFAGATYREPGAVYALVVGIDDYPGADYDLAYAVSDANLVDAALARFGVPEANRVVLRNGQAQHAELVHAVRALVDRAGAGSTIVLAFAGHIRKVDADTEEMLAADGGTIRDTELAALLAPARSQQMWVLLASCYAGGFDEILAPGRILTAAADADSIAYESSTVEGSYLVHHMVREGWLRGAAGGSVQSAYSYARAAMQGSNREGRPVQYDMSGQPLRLDTTPGTTTAPPTTAAPPSSPPPTSTEPDDDDPERHCTLLVLCSRS